MRITITDWIHDVLRGHIKEGDFCIDATMGKGNDTLFLCRMAGKDGKVAAFDIQQTALDHTKERLAEADFLQRVTLLHLDHSIMDTVIKEKIAAVVFNLGYLPGGSHQIITEPRKTITALEHSLELLQSGGVILIGVYWGHPGGEIEKNAVEQWLRQLPAADYDIMETSFPNRQKAPIVITLQKKC